MCGIAGIWRGGAPERDRVAAERMADALAHRGPDASGVLAAGDTVFAHRRLAILDLSRAADQPMLNASGDCMIVFNGEIYNFPELRRGLEARGVRFRTEGDTEVILELFVRDGEAGLEKLDGMFALALFRKSTGEFLLMRDRLGKKPLYYFRAGETVIFASELAALKRHPLWRGVLREQAIHDFLAFEYVPEPETVYHGVWKVPAATVIRFAPGSEPRARRYWQADLSERRDISFADAAEELRRLMRRAAARRLIADVPCGVFLSGGVDSAVVTALAAEAAAQSGRELTAFTIGFEVDRYDERAFARRTAEAVRRRGLPLVHREEVVDFRSFPVLEKLAVHCGEPFADFSMLPEYFLSRFAAKEVKVALSGDGADELFSGYERYWVMRFLDRCDRIPRSLKSWGAGVLGLFPDGGKRSRVGRAKRLLTVAAEPSETRYFALMSQASEAVRRGLYGERLREAGLSPSSRVFTRLEETLRAPDRIGKCQELDMATYLVGDILVKVDRASMANSLEVRSPFLDTAVVEFAASLPTSFKQAGRSRKHILKAAFDDLVDPVVRGGRKRGFAVPLGRWLRSEWYDLARERLLEGVLVREQWMRRDGLSALLSAHRGGRRDETELLGALLMLELFLENETH